MARPTSLTPAVQAAIVEAIKRGHYRETAANLAGVSYRSMRRWEEAGEAEGATGLYADFAHALKQAEAEAEDTLLQAIMTAQPAVVGVSGADQWQAKAWVMERRWPKRWSGRVRVTVNEELAALLKRVEVKLDPDTFAKVVDAAREDAPGEEAGTRH